MDTKTASAVTEFVTVAQNLINEHYRKDYPNLTPGRLSIEPGRRYVRVVNDVHGQRMVYAFVDTTNGDILKPAGWRAPAKHARGNVFNADHGLDALTSVGVKYLA